MSDTEINQVAFLSGAILLAARLNAEAQDIPTELVCRALTFSLFKFVARNFNADDADGFCDHITREGAGILKQMQSNLAAQDASDAMGEPRGTA